MRVVVDELDGEILVDQSLTLEEIKAIEEGIIISKLFEIGGKLFSFGIMRDLGESCEFDDGSIN